MKILYIGISSKYIHTMPAGWFLAEFLASKGLNIEELYLNINVPYKDILNEITAKEFDTLLFSVYIFNVEIIKRLIKDIKSNRPECTIIAGGPEVTLDFEADHIIIGEGEQALYKLLINGGGKVIREELIENLDLIPSPYTQARLNMSKNKLIYYEASRGCPFKCSYCMASLSSGVRYFSIGRVKEDLIRIVNSGAKIIKFTDRTFNADIKRSNEILQFILDTFKGSKVCFHIEVGGDLFTRSTLDLLKKMPIGLIQMEAGVQTLNLKTLKAIDRVFDITKFERNISEIISFNNIHLHLDLIAGLPYDNRETFKESFNRVIALKPDMLQLGFLKFLKGTPIRNNYIAEFSKTAPYEVISTPDMTTADFAELKLIEIAVDRLYNSGKFINSLNTLITEYDNPYDMYRDISRQLVNSSIAKNAQEFLLYEGMLSIMKNISDAKDILKFDYMLTNNSKILPDCLKVNYSAEFKKFLSHNKCGANICYEPFNYLPIENCSGEFYLKFDYSVRNPISGQYRYEII